MTVFSLKLMYFKCVFTIHCTDQYTLNTVWNRVCFEPVSFACMAWNFTHVYLSPGYNFVSLWVANRPLATRPRPDINNTLHLLALLLYRMRNFRMTARTRFTKNVSQWLSLKSKFMNIIAIREIKLSKKFMPHSTYSSL